MNELFDSFPTSSFDFSKSGDPAIRSFIFAAGLCQTHRSDVVVEGYRWGQSQQGDVIIECFVIKRRMSDDPGHMSGHHVGVQGI